MKGDKMAKRYSFGSVMRKRFSDITNSFPEHSSPANVKDVQPPDSSSSDKDILDNLVKENLALVKLIQDKNNIIETNGIELGLHRINLQKMQLQNWNLAQANSRMITELNFGKRKLKSVQHELSCKEALLKATNEDLKKGEAITGDVKADEEDGKSNLHTRPLGLTRSRSLGHAISTQQGADKDAAENKRRCLRGQTSTNSEMHQMETIGNLLEMEVTNFSLASTHFNRKNASPSISKAARLEKDGFGFKCKQPERRSSIGRPLRKAAEKVQSYRETPLNLKMRRND